MNENANNYLLLSTFLINGHARLFFSRNKFHPTHWFWRNRLKIPSYPFEFFTLPVYVLGRQEYILNVSLFWYVLHKLRKKAYLAGSSIFICWHNLHFTKTLWGYSHLVWTFLIQFWYVVITTCQQCQKNQLIAEPTADKLSFVGLFHELCSV